MDPEAIAVVCHESNRALCQTAGDFSQAPWPDAPEWQRTSAITGVRNILSGTITAPGQCHEAWLADKVAAGWVHGPVKDAEATPPTHPCIVPFAELSEHDQRKDALFYNIVSALR